MNDKNSLLAIVLLALCCVGMATKSIASAEQSPAELAHMLGWSPGPVSKNLCAGYYEVSEFAPFPNEQVPLFQGPIEITAKQSELTLQQGLSSLTGGVVLRQPDRLLKADKARFKRDAKTGKISEIYLEGNVYWEEPGKLIVGNAAHLQLLNKTGTLDQAVYRLTLDERAQLISPRSSASSLRGTQIYSLNAWGKAYFVEQKKAGLIELKQASYTTCTPLSDTWQVQAKKISLNREVGRGTARDVTLRVKDVPVFYTPYFNFPIDKRRQTGFLFPIMKNSSSSGFNLATPYYLNLAPNYDATITPGVFTKRDLKIDALFRYLTPTSHGEFNAAVLPHDAAFGDFRDTARDLYPSAFGLSDLENASDTRQFFAWKNKTTFNDHWSSHVDYSYVSDDYYFQDFGNTPAVIGTNQLLRKADVNYAGENWVFRSELQSYETLHPVNQSETENQYSSLPRIQFNGNFPSQKYGLSYQLQNEYVYFSRSVGPSDSVTPPSAQRAHLQPGMSLPLSSVAGYVTPQLQLAATQYRITDQAVGFPENITSTIPIFNIDSGVYLDRQIAWRGRHYQQTLEPRVFYLYVPFHDQTEVPVFDSTLPPFNYDQLFRINRFNGSDRVGDANQVTLAVTTRFLDQKNGDEKFRASVGQIYYFRDRDVSLCDPFHCEDTSTTPGATSTTESSSPIAGQLDYLISPRWSTIANLAWDPNIHRTINSNLAFQYHPAPNHLVNLGYSFIRFGDVLKQDPPLPADSSKNNLNQPNISFVWPLNEKWRTVGSYNYNLSHNHPQTYFYGIEYNSCCWAVRLVAARTFTSLNQNDDPVFDNAIYLQWQLKGLGNMAVNDPSGLLVSGISGYADRFGQI